MNGKKTYMVALGGLLAAIGGYLSGGLDASAALQLGFSAVAAAAVPGLVESAR